MIGLEVSFNTGAIASLIALATTIVGFLWAIFRIYTRIEKLEQKSNEQKEDMKLVLETLFGVLDGLKQLKCNGEVSKAYERLRHHVIGH